MANAPTDLPELEYDNILQSFLAATDDTELFRLIVNAPFDNTVATALLFLGIVTLRLVDKKAGAIRHVAISNTEIARDAGRDSSIPFRDIEIPLNQPQNVIAAAIRTGKRQETTDWSYLFWPTLTVDESRLNQASGGIAYSAVYPFQTRDGGALIFSYFQYKQDIGELQNHFMRRYTDIAEQALQQRA